MSGGGTGLMSGGGLSIGSGGRGMPAGCSSMWRQVQQVRRSTLSRHGDQGP
jgi:hypothetical protein